MQNTSEEVFYIRSSSKPFTNLTTGKLLFAAAYKYIRIGQNESQ